MQILVIFAFSLDLNICECGGIKLKFCWRIKFTTLNQSTQQNESSRMLWLLLFMQVTFFEILFVQLYTTPIQPKKMVYCLCCQHIFKLTTKTNHLLLLNRCCTKLDYFKGRNFRRTNFGDFANFRLNRESLIPRKVSLALIRESLFPRKKIKSLVREM